MGALQKGQVLFPGPTGHFSRTFFFFTRSGVPVHGSRGSLSLTALMVANRRRWVLAVAHGRTGTEGRGLYMSWTMRGVRRTTGSLLIAASLVVAGGCSSRSSGVHLETPDPPSSASSLPTSSAIISSTQTSSQPSVSSTSSLASSSKTPPTTTPPTTTPSTTTAKATTAADPWPANFTAAQQTYARGALAAFSGFTTVAAAAEKQPSKDWTKAIRKYTADPTASSTLDSLASLATAKVHATTTETHEAPRVVSATAKEVVLESCVDGSKLALADASGEKVDLRPSPHPRVLLTYNVYQYGPKVGGWLVSETVAQTPVKPC